MYIILLQNLILSNFYITALSEPVLFRISTANILKVKLKLSVRVQCPYTWFINKC